MKTTIFAIALLLVLAFPSMFYAQEATAKVRVPVVSQALTTKLFKLTGKVATTRLALEHSKEWSEAKQAEVDQAVAVAEWRTACGSEYDIAETLAGDPGCVVKPKLAKAPVPVESTGPEVKK